MAHRIFVFCTGIFKNNKSYCMKHSVAKGKHGNFFDILHRDFLKILKMASIAFSNLICLVCSQFSIYRFGSGTK